ncbi:hypothetical protein HAP48_0037565 [Bradyrhizobium septentrionale]|uniref:Uncharacterized protein n=1 Tax=Bradyrhizobium septentrionale TaxID=1404411 RepID=A0A973W0Y4_9BRAD|nr:hypothetical protein [Bradyrhizobium septentrionale]UGY14226.1 hypothetical protein HAP48_0037565 [Bradyrhizobium septentrionale]
MQDFARYIAKSQLLTLVTLILMVVPFFYQPWYFAVAIAIGVQVASWIIRAAFTSIAARSSSNDVGGY